MASIKAFPDGSWHDETLSRLAAITQGQAAAQAAEPPPGKTEKPK